MFSHGHWDHVMGHAAFPGVPVWLAAGLDRDIAAGEARAIADADAVYLQTLRDHAARGDAAAALAMRWPRATDVAGMREHHLDNCRKLGLAVGPP